MEDSSTDDSSDEEEDEEVVLSDDEVQDMLREHLKQCAISKSFQVKPDTCIEKYAFYGSSLVGEHDKYHDRLKRLNKITPSEKMSPVPCPSTPSAVNKSNDATTLHKQTNLKASFSGKLADPISEVGS